MAIQIFTKKVIEHEQLICKEEVKYRIPGNLATALIW